MTPRQRTGLGQRSRNRQTRARPLPQLQRCAQTERSAIVDREAEACCITLLCSFCCRT